VSTLKNLSRGGYIVVGIVAALVLVPTGIAAAATVYNGIVGVSGYKGAMVMAVSDTPQRSHPARRDFPAFEGLGEEVTPLLLPVPPASGARWDFRPLRPEHESLSM